jgi:hypothetical protein
VGLPARACSLRPRGWKRRSWWTPHWSTARCRPLARARTRAARPGCTSPLPAGAASSRAAFFPARRGRAESGHRALPRAAAPPHISIFEAVAGLYDPATRSAAVSAAVCEGVPDLVEAVGARGGGASRRLRRRRERASGAEDESKRGSRWFAAKGEIPRNAQRRRGYHKL